MTTELQRRDSGLSISSFHSQKDQIIILHKAEKSFFPPSAAILVTSRSWATLADPAQPDSSRDSIINYNLMDSPSRSRQDNRWRLDENCLPLPIAQCLPPSVSKRQSVSCIVVGLLVCTVISLALGVTIHLQHVNTNFDGALGPTGSAPSVIPGSPLPVFGITEVYGNGSAPVYFGAEINWKYNDPAFFNSQLKYAAAIQDATFYLGATWDSCAFVNSSGVWHQVDDVYSWKANLIRGTGAIMGITVIPSVTLSSISSVVLAALAEKCKEVNQMGIPVLLRYAPEMNGNWFVYGQDPVKFVTSFRELTVLVRNSTNNTAMVWSPASGLDYPFAQNYISPKKMETRFMALDTNLDGVLNREDDPYGPYYPGDAFVDWMGFSLYYSSTHEVFPFANMNATQNTIFPTVTTMSPSVKSTPVTQTSSTTNSVTATTIQTAFMTNLPISSSTTGAVPQISSDNFNFYKTYVALKNKPMLILTGASYLRGALVLDSVAEATLKGAWAKEFLSVAFFAEFPLLRGVVFTDFMKPLNETSFAFLNNEDQRTQVDFRISANVSVLSDYQQLISSLISRDSGENRSSLTFASSIGFNLTAVAVVAPS